ncbi:MAG: hypothetical protein JNJ57_00320 [Saprospiraceae bacterium]|nr:hypothetical protein [Saprospiraceae bacterium]
MEVLKEIAYTLTRYQVRQVDVITNPETKPTKKDNRYWDAYVGLRENKWQNDQELASAFGLEYPSKSYNRFKNELKDRLWSTLLFTEGVGRDRNESVSALQELVKNWSVATMLLMRGALFAFWELANECLTIALEHEFLKHVVDITGMMKSYCVTNPQMKKEYLRVQQIYDAYWPNYIAEENLRNAYETFASDLAFSKGYKKDFAPVAAKLAEDFQLDSKSFDTAQLHFYYRILLFYSKVLNHEWVAAHQVADEALQFFLQKKNRRPYHVIAFYNQKASCLLMLGRYDEANKALDSALEYTSPDSSHHFKNRELATVNAMYASQYAVAWELCKSAIKQERFSKIPMIDQESWRIYYGYLHFLAQTKQFEISAREKGELPRFRLNAWLNDLPLHGRDKRGAQIPVLILQTLLLFHEHRWDELESRIEALRKFRQRNLDPFDEHFRTNCFIHLLELLPKYAYDVQALKEKSAPWLKKMTGGEIDILDRTFEIEVVPYERQWSWIMQIAGASKTVAEPADKYWYKIAH